MTVKVLRQKYLDFFTARNHKILPNVSLIPENDPTTLFISAGMQPLVPYLLGEPHPLGKRLVSNQRCLRTDDIDEIGDNRHLTFMEMLGNWSLGDYFKKEQLNWAFEFLTSSQWLNLPPEKLYVSVFEGDQDAPLDKESIAIWQEIFRKAGIKAKVGERIIPYPKKKNWWGPAGKTGPCGPDSEIFYDTGKSHDPRFGKKCHINCDCGRYIEIWNDVFMEFNRLPSGKLEKLKQRNIDTGMGVERTTAVLQGKDDVYQTELFSGLITQIEQISGRKYEKENQRAMRIIADHLRATTFALADGVKPSNVEAGYIVRRLIRRAIRYGKLININQAFITQIVKIVVEEFKKDYSHLEKNRDFLLKESKEEEERFRRVIESGLKKSEKIFSQKTPVDFKKYSQLMQFEDKKEFFRQIYRSFKGKDKKGEKFDVPVTKQEIAKATVSGKEAFDLYQTFGFPIEMIIELVQEKRLLVDIEDYQEEVKKHQELSRTNLNKKFAGGLADHSAEVTKLHTATHLLHQALRDVLGDRVQQVGSNITPERLRFDFTHPEKLTETEIKQIENIVNKQIKADLPVEMEVMKLEEAKRRGALAFFKEKYGEKVKVYSIGPCPSSGRPYSVEVCGGPHVDFTGKLRSFKMIKEESAGSGIRRIYAKLS